MLHSTPFFFFFFNDTATTEIYTLSLHDALPISSVISREKKPVVSPRTFTACSPSFRVAGGSFPTSRSRRRSGSCRPRDRKSTRLNSSHLVISYAVFCLKKKKKNYGYMSNTRYAG